MPVAGSCSLVAIRKSQQSLLGLAPDSSEGMAWPWASFGCPSGAAGAASPALTRWLCPREEAAPALVPSMCLVKKVSVTWKRQRQFSSRDLRGTEIYVEHHLRTKAHLFRVTSNEVRFSGQCFYSFCDKCHMKSGLKPTCVNFKWHYFHYHNLRLSEQ